MRPFEPWQKLFTREKWRSRYSGLLESLVLASHDGYLVGLFPTGDGFMFRLDEEAGEFVRISQTGYCGFVLPQTDGLYIGTDYGIVQYASGEPGTARWWSKEFTLPKPASFGAIEICGSGQIIVHSGRRRVAIRYCQRHGGAAQWSAFRLDGRRSAGCSC